MYKSLIKPSIDLISLLTITLTLRQQLTATKKQPLATSSKSSSSPLTAPLLAPRRPTTKITTAPTTYQCQMLRQNLNEFIIKSNNNNNNNNNNNKNNNNKLRITNIFYNTYDYAVVLFTLLLLLVEIPLSVHAGLCREAQLCCNGRDSSCVVQKAPINAIIEDLSDKPCYCDHACLKLGDCCVDFKDHCGVLDCQVSDWGQWSECNASCGTGIMTRTRKILQSPQNGGKHCPTLMQKRGCQGYRCHGHHDKKILRETALLLPAALSYSRHANDSHDIRRNLRLRYHDSYKHNRELEYCVEFEVLKSSKTCHKLPPYNLMIEGDRITVRCDLEAFVYDNSRSNSIKNDTRKSQTHLATNLEFMQNSQQQNLDDDNESLEENDEEEDDENMIDGSSSDQEQQQDDYDSLTLKRKVRTTTSTTTTTTTAIAPALLNTPPNYHCRGEGLPGRTTRWSALAAPSCRGKWLRLTLRTPKKCTHAQFIYV